MRLDVAVKCNRFLDFLKNFLDGCFNNRGMGVWLLKFFFGYVSACICSSAPPTTQPRGAKSGFCGTILALHCNLNTFALSYFIQRPLCKVIFQLCTGHTYVLLLCCNKSRDLWIT
jgi:hypothetical protein